MLFNFEAAPMKLVPESEKRSVHCPLHEINLVRASLYALSPMRFPNGLL